MIFPWWSKYVAYLTILIWACGYTGLKVATHYQDKIAAIEVVGAIQEKRTKQIDVKQREVTKNVSKQVKRDIALSDDFYRMRYPNPGKMPYSTGSPGGTDEAPKAASPNPPCDPKDGSADAITILGWQRFYSDLKSAQQTLTDP